MIFQQELLAQVQAEIEALLGTYEEELPLPFKLKPDFEQYQNLENLGALLIITARENEELLGYFVMTLSPNLNEAGQLIAFGVTLFLRKEFRKGLLGVRLIKKGEEVAKQKGAKCVMIASQEISPIDKLLTLRGYSPTERIFAKRI